MLFQCIAEYLWPRVKFAAQIITSFLWFVLIIFGLNIFAAVI